MKFIALTIHSFEREQIRPVFINIDDIGHVYQSTDRKDAYSPDVKITVVGVGTHNNGGFRVSESPQRVLKLIEEADRLNREEAA